MLLRKNLFFCGIRVLWRPFLPVLSFRGAWFSLKVMSGGGSHPSPPPLFLSQITDSLSARANQILPRTVPHRSLFVLIAFLLLGSDSLFVICLFFTLVEVATAKASVPAREVQEGRAQDGSEEGALVRPPSVIVLEGASEKHEKVAVQDSVAKNSAKSPQEKEKNKGRRRRGEFSVHGRPPTKNHQPAPSNGPEFQMTHQWLPPYLISSPKFHECRLCRARMRDPWAYGPPHW